MKEFTTIVNHKGNGTTVPTLKTIYNSYARGTVDKTQATNFLYDWGLVSYQELKEANGQSK